MTGTTNNVLPYLKTAALRWKKVEKVLIVEMIVPEGNEPFPAKFLDLQMLQYLPGCERTEKEYKELTAK